VSYQRSWSDGRIGFPVSNIEDLYAGTDLLFEGMMAIGIVPNLTSRGNIQIGPALCLDDNGQLIAERMRWCVRALFKAMETINKYWKQGF
jgi:hypothetical protein